MRSGSRPSLEGTRLLFAAGTVSPMMCPADGQQKDDKKCRTEEQPRWGQSQSRKKQEYTATRWWIFVGFVFTWCFEVIRCDMAWYIAIYRDIISHVVRHRKIRYIEIWYPYPEFLRLISRCRIPSKYSSIPNTIFCPISPSLVHQDTLYART